MNKNEQLLLKSLYKKTPKETPANHSIVYKPNKVHEIDILYVPEDNGYKYILSVVDVNNSLFEARGLKTRNKVEIIDKLNDIYRNSKYLNKPELIQADNEFNDKYFKDYCYVNKIVLSFGEPYRSRQQAHVERVNNIIGKKIFENQTLNEMKTQERDTSWTRILPKIIKEENEKTIKNNNLDKNEDYLKEHPMKITDPGIRINKYAIVRIKLEKATEFLTGKPLPGPFRNTDIRWSNKLYLVVDEIITYNNPALYRVKEILNYNDIYKLFMNNLEGPQITLKLNNRKPINALFNGNCLQVILNPKSYKDKIKINFDK